MATIAQVQEQLVVLTRRKEEVARKAKNLLAQELSVTRETEIPCMCCGNQILLRRYTFIQRQHYIAPYGHTGGDFWMDSLAEVCYLKCPDCSGRSYIYNHPNRDILVTMLKSACNLELVFEAKIVTEEQ